MLETYFQELLEEIAASPIVRLHDVALDKRAPRAGLIRGDLYFADGSRLHFRELVAFQTDVVRLGYSYHYQRADHSLIFRYDDTPHYPDLPNFPHHKHTDSEPNPAPVAPPLRRRHSTLPALPEKTLQYDFSPIPPPPQVLY